MHTQGTQGACASAASASSYRLVYGTLVVVKIDQYLVKIWTREWWWLVSMSMSMNSAVHESLLFLRQPWQMWTDRNSFIVRPEVNCGIKVCCIGSQNCSDNRNVQSFSERLSVTAQYAGCSTTTNTDRNFCYRDIGDIATTDLWNAINIKQCIYRISADKKDTNIKTSLSKV